MKPSKKKKHKLPMEKSLGYVLIFLLAILVLWIILATTSHSGDKYSGKTSILERQMGRLLTFSL